MRKYAYLAKLEELLGALPPQERQDALNYYEEYFDAAGSENEEKTAEELGDPATVARKILEEEEVAETESPEQEETAPSGEEDTPKPVTPPEGPEPPTLEKPEQYPTSGAASYSGKKPERKGPRLWLIFWLVVILALVVQVSVLLMNVTGLGGNSAYQMAASSVEYAESAAVEYTESVPVSPTAFAQEEPRPTDSGSGMGDDAITYSGTLETPGDGKLFITLTCGTLTLKTGEEASVEVRNVDVSDNVSYGSTVDYGYAFVCNSTDPDTQVTITLPPHAFYSVEAKITTSGNIDLGNLQINQIDAFTAEGSIQSGTLQAAYLNVQSASGDIRLDKIADGNGYDANDVCLQAPHGSVTASFSAPRDEWQAEITAPEGIVETLTDNGISENAPRKLEVLAAETAELQYGVQ